MKIFEIASYFIKLAKDQNDFMSNMKLQKLCYYAQGLNLVKNKTTLFDDNIEAWYHGPVIRTLYDKYKQHRASNITEEDINYTLINEDDKSIIKETHDKFSGFSAWKLRMMSHDETPWSKNYEEGLNNIISTDDISNFFADVMSSEETGADIKKKISDKIIRENSEAFKILADK